MNKTKFCKRMYNTNQQFKEYCDKLANDSYPENKIPDIFSYETVYDIAQYYASKEQEPKVTKTTTVVSCGCNEQEDDKVIQFKTILTPDAFKQFLKEDKSC